MAGEPVADAGLTRTEKRSYEGPARWRAPALIADLGPLFSVEVLSCRTSSRRLGMRQSLTVRARGARPDLARFWRRVDEVTGAHDRNGRVPRSWRNSLRESLNPWSW